MTPNTRTHAPPNPGHRSKLRRPWLTLAVLNQKGGVGKTTLAMNLAAASHLEGHRTVVVDLDAQQSAYDWFNARSDTSTLNGLAVVCAEKAMTLGKFAEITAGYDVAILDGPPRISEVSRAAAVAADVVFVPLRAGHLDWWACKRTSDLLDDAEALRQQIGRAPLRRVFGLNAAVGRTRLAAFAEQALPEAKLGEIAPAIGSRVLFAACAESGESVLTLDREGVAAAEIGAVWRLLRGEVLDGRD